MCGVNFCLKREANRKFRPPFQRRRFLKAEPWAAHRSERNSFSFAKRRKVWKPSPGVFKCEAPAENEWSLCRCCAQALSQTITMRIFQAFNASHRETPGEGFPRKNHPPDNFSSLPALYEAQVFRALRSATRSAAPWPRRLWKGGRNFIFASRFKQQFIILLR